MGLVRARGSQQGVEIGCELGDRPLWLEADHEQLRQLFLNLLLNALDALPKGGKIRIAASQSGPPPASTGDVPGRAHGEAAAPWITMTVSDNGPGIPGDLGDRIFAPYVSTKETGLGLGLAICRRIVQSHGGQITATRAATGGAVFTVQLPSRSPASHEPTRSPR